MHSALVQVRESVIIARPRPHEMPSTTESNSSPQELAPDSVFGPYRIQRLLGRGGMGAVYEAQHLADGRVVALKLLTVDLDKMDARERFLREGQTAAAINHPNAVYIYGTEEIEGTPAITMEIVPGGTLDDKVKQQGALPWQEAVEDILQVIDGLDAAYNAGILHRDVKPSNCFVGPGGVVKIGDFGLSKPIDGTDQLKLTQTGLFLGTPVFSSPEQLLGESLDVRSDIYAVGVTFYQLLTGALPYASGSMMQVVASVLNGVPAPITNSRQDLPPALVAVAMKAMARKPADRFQSYDEFRAAVAALRVVERTPATLWDRFRASVVDWGVNVMLLGLIGVVWVNPSVSGTPRNADWRQVLISLTITLLVVGIPEALRGVSLGKWLVGIRVIGPANGPPGFLREAGRILLIGTVDFATLAVQMSVADPARKAGATMLATVLLRALFLVTARRSNGWRLLHDFATGTRVVRPQLAMGPRRSETARATAPAMSGAERKIGPYTIVGEARAGDGVLSGWDHTMRRAVWIVPRAEGEPETSAARRSMSRLCRLRWVGGRRSGADSWDAFETPLGEPLSERLKRPVPWSAQQNWLLDLSEETIAARADGTSFEGASIDALWVTPTDRLVLIEGARVSGPGGASLVSQLCSAIAAASANSEPLPRYASRTFELASKAASPEEVKSLVQSTLGRPLSVTRARRLGMTLATVAPIIALSLIGWFSMTRSIRIDPKGYLMSSIVSFVADSSRTNADSVRARAARDQVTTIRTRKFALALESLGVVPVIAPDTITPADTLRAQRRLAEVYLATALRARTRDTVAQSMFGGTERERKQSSAILARNANVDSNDARNARMLVDSVWRGTIPGVDAGNIPKYIGFVMAGGVMIFSAAFAILFGLLVRRGPMLRGFQLDIVNHKGEPAGRLRLLLRNIFVWSSLLAPVPAILLAPVVSVKVLATIIVISTLVYLAILGLCIWVLSKSPSRGIPERLSGTWLVPE